MIRRLAFRNIAYRPWRSLLLFFGYGVGVGVMIVLLSIGEAMLTQARNERLVGGGTITVLPEGLDIEVMKTGGIGGLFFSIDHASFLYRQLLASPRLERDVRAVAPQIEGRLLYARTSDGTEYAVYAAGEIPAASEAVGAAPTILDGTWTNDEGDRRWTSPTLAELRHEIDRFHLPSDSLANRDTWGEWHYFNVMSDGGKRWAFISFIVGGDVTGTDWGGNLGITLREQGGRTRKFATRVDRSRVRFSTASANVVFGDSRVEVLPNGDYRVRATAREENGAGRIDISLTVSPAPFAYFPGVSMGAGDFVSGYTVPALRASASGTLCVDGRCEVLTRAQAYHDHNWGVWKGVTWEWGAGRAGEYTFLYGRVHAPDSAASRPPVLVYLIDSLGFRGVFRPRTISYSDRRSVRIAGRTIAVPARAVLFDERDGDTLSIEIDIEDAIATDMRVEREAMGVETRNEDAPATPALKPYFIQMKGTARISGRLEGMRVEGTGTGFFETFR
ncbi:MAG TPA: hypothetical protein VFS56_12280 [Gemmatimonadaceae bacterium]|nr:hypothetical protein [Gemmatimonadaceae bacterium]